MALADEELVDFVVHHEPTFNRDEIHRHVTVLALTPSRLLVGHTDDHHGDPPESGTSAAASTESVPLQQDRHRRRHPGRAANQRRTRPGPSASTKTWLTVGWGTMRRIDLEQASCEDPECEADHGYTGLVGGRRLDRPDECGGRGRRASGPPGPVR